MINLKELHPQYITDDSGEKTAVVLQISDFEELLEDIEDLAIAAERRDEDTQSHESLKEKLKKNGLIGHRKDIYKKLS
ncbi:MAG: hypothetical protein ACYTFY_22930 [Planctomycetota bacterium]|jgi:hypothetical protein